MSLVLHYLLSVCVALTCVDTKYTTLTDDVIPDNGIMSEILRAFPNKTSTDIYAHRATTRNDIRSTSTLFNKSTYTTVPNTATNASFWVFPAPIPMIELCFYAPKFRSIQPILFNIKRNKVTNKNYSSNQGSDKVHRDVTNTPQQTQTLSNKSSHTKIRHQRGSPIFYIDVVAVVDYSVYKIFQHYPGVTDVTMAIKEHMAFVFDSVKRIYADTAFGFELKIRLVKVVVWKTPSEFPLEHSKINPKRQLQWFASYTGTVNGRSQLGQYDHATLYFVPDSDIRQGEDIVLGQAYVGEMCDPFNRGHSISIVKYSWGFNAVYTTAHEMAHSLGAVHDDDVNLCSGQENFIMQSVLGVSKDKWTNAWKFSKCSIEDIRNYILSVLRPLRSGNRCLAQYVPVSDDIPDVTSKYLGQEFDSNDQCRLIHGQDSFVCPLDPMFSCTSIYCYTSSLKKCVDMTPVRGTSCGNKKMCLKGVCQIHKDAATLNEQCPYGELQNPRIKGIKVCGDLISQQCYNDVIFRRCCQTCMGFYEPYKNCEFGDKMMGCSQRHCHSSECDQDCCRTCGKCETIVVSPKHIQPTNNSSGMSNPNDYRVVTPIINITTTDVNLTTAAPEEDVVLVASTVLLAIAITSVVLVFLIMAAGLCYYKYQHQAKGMAIGIELQPTGRP